MNSNKWLKKLLSFILSHSPKSIRPHLIRSQINVPLALESNYVFKIAETQQELEDAFRLVYQSYHKLGYCSTNDYGLRGTKYHALKSTTTLIAKLGGRVVGTLTVVRDNPTFGLPIEQTFPIQSLRTGGHRLAEITSMVIDPDYRQRSGGKILFPLLKLMHEYTTFYFGTNKLVIAIRPKDQDFYQSLLMFEPLNSGLAREYLGAPAMIMSLDLDKAEDKFFNAYSNEKDSKNLYYFFRELETPYVRLPERPLFFINDQVVNNQIYHDLFIQKLKIQDAKLDQLFQQQSNPVYATRAQRFEIDAPAQITAHLKSAIQTTSFLNISEDGFRTKFISGIEIGQTVEFTLYFSVDKKLQISGKVMWVSAENGVGFQVESRDVIWQNLIQFLKHQNILANETNSTN